MTRATRHRATAGMVIWIIQMTLTIAIWAALTGIDVRSWGVLRGLALSAAIAVLLIWRWRRGGGSR